jgi:DNA-binding transcriptional LysR family regulator
MTSLRQIRYFIAAAEAKKITSAASALNISQSAITIAVQELEAELGVSLFTRSASGISLTFEGVRFLAHARNIEATIADAVRAMRSELHMLKGRLRLGMTYTVAGYFLFPLLARFRRTFPEVTVELHEDDRSETERRLKAGEIDLALLLVSNLEDRARIAHRTLLRSKRRLWLPSSHRLLKEPKVTMADIANEPYVFLNADEADRSAGAYWRKNKTKPNVVFRTSSIEAVRSMVATGAAVTILSDMIYRPWSLDGGRVETKDIAGSIPTMDVGFAWVGKRPLSEVAKTFDEFIRSAVRN